MASERSGSPSALGGRLGWLGLGWILWSGPALADDDPWVRVVVPAGELVPGRAEAVRVAAGRGGEVPARPPAVTVSSGLLRYGGEVRPGVWAYRLQPFVGGEPEPTRVRVEAFDRVWETELPVGLPPDADLQIPRRVDGWTHGVRAGAGGGVFSARQEGRVVQVPVTGPDLPPPEALQVVVGEGHVEGIEAEDGALTVRIRVGDSPFPRVIPVGVRDRRSDAQPAWGWIRLRARPVLPLRSDPGVSVTLGVSGRTYGPFLADEEGAIAAFVEQWPGETVASAVFTDDLGNETRTELPLAASPQGWLVAMLGSDIVPGDPMPLVWLWGLAPDGTPLPGTPTCRTPAADLPVHPVGPGRWMTAAPVVDGEPEDVRIECAIPSGNGPASQPVTASLRVPVAEGVPDRLRMRLWPTELRADLPLAEVRVALEDLRGERLPVDGVRVRAAHGDVVLEQAHGATVRRGEYVGSAAVDVGRDQLTAVYEAPDPGERAHRLRLAWGPMTGEGPWEVRARAEDLRRRPVVDAAVTLEVDGVRAEASTGEDGWASAAFELPARAGPVVIEARHAGIVARAPVLRGSLGYAGESELVDVREVSITPGTVAGVSIDLDPPVIQAAPGATALVRVRVEDRSGHAVADEEVTLEATAGRVGRTRRRPDGTWVAEFTLGAGESPREVLLTARTGTVRSTATLRVEPREVRVSLGPWVAAQSNLGGVHAVVLGFDADFHLRMPVIGAPGVLRFGAGTYTISGEAPTRLGAPARVQSSLLPLSVLALIRQEAGRFGVYAGAGATLAVQRMELRFGDTVVSRGTTLHIGPQLAAGVARRLGTGELIGELRSTWLHSGGGDFGFNGNIGGLAAGLGYRVVF